jgi:hypothetical protein
MFSAHLVKIAIWKSPAADIPAPALRQSVLLRTARVAIDSVELDPMAPHPTPYWPVTVAVGPTENRYPRSRTLGDHILLDQEGDVCGSDQAVSAAAFNSGPQDLPEGRFQPDAVMRAVPDEIAFNMNVAKGFNEDAGAIALDGITRDGRLSDLRVTGGDGRATT